MSRPQLCESIMALQAAAMGNTRGTAIGNTRGPAMGNTRGAVMGNTRGAAMGNTRGAVECRKGERTEDRPELVKPQQGCPCQQQPVCHCHQR